MAVLNRIGNKAKLAKKIVPLFPEHKTFVDLFFGAGGMFFNKPKAQYNICNDIDENVSNFWQVIANMVAKDSKDRFVKELINLPIHTSLWKKYQKTQFEDPIMKAVFFCFYSNFGFMGKTETMNIKSSNNQKNIILKSIDAVSECIADVQWANFDFRKLLKSISFITDRANTFIYADPPYLGARGNYSHYLKENDTVDLFDVLVDSGCKFAISEFNNPIILKLAKQRKLQVIEICERQTLGNRQTEILIVNYPIKK